MKKIVSAAVLALSTLTLQAGPVSETIQAIEGLPDVELTEITSDQFSDSVINIKNGKVMVISDHSAPTIMKFLAALPQETLWLYITDGEEIISQMYGEKEDEGPDYNIILKMAEGDQMMLFLLKGGVPK